MTLPGIELTHRTGAEALLPDIAKLRPAEGPFYALLQAFPLHAVRLLPPCRRSHRRPEILAVRAHLPAPWQDILDLAYYSGWRKNEILGLTREEIDEAGGVIRLSPARSKTLIVADQRSSDWGHAF